MRRPLLAGLVGAVVAALAFLAVLTFTDVRVTTETTPSREQLIHALLTPELQTGRSHRSSTSTTAVARTELGGGVSIRYGPGWHLIAHGTRAHPQQQMLLTSYPTKNGGNCNFPGYAEKDLPADGALIFLIDYHPAGGPVWGPHLFHRADFPPRPTHFALDRNDLALRKCWLVPSYIMLFRAVNRPFELHVALGKRVTGARRAQVLRIIDSLRFSPTKTHSAGGG